jgi:hypothetical protein
MDAIAAMPCDFIDESNSVRVIDVLSVRSIW